MTTDLPALVDRQRVNAAAEAENVQTLHDAAAHSHSPSDRLAYALDQWLVTHPDAPVSSPADYPNWTPPHLETL
jgi:hypothetical protein